jgi:hypothetical protein
MDNGFISLDQRLGLAVSKWTRDWDWLYLTVPVIGTDSNWTSDWDWLYLTGPVTDIGSIYVYKTIKFDVIKVLLV